MTAFLNNAEGCQHFSGEWDSNLSAARQKEIEKAVDASCSKAKGQKDELMKKYRGDKSMEAQLDEYDF